MKKILIFLVFIWLQISSFPIKRNPKRELQDSRSKDIIILHTNDVHCGVQDKIGYDGLMLYKRQMMAKYQNVLLVDAGDHIQGGTIGLITNGEAIIDIMNKIGYDAVTLGNHEFDYGIPQLEKLNKSLNGGYISTNYCFKANKTSTVDGKTVYNSIYPAYKIIEAGDKKIAFIGVATPQTLTKTSLVTITDNNGQVYDFLTDTINGVYQLFDAVQKQVNEVKSNGANYVILLAHLGTGGDESYNESSEGLLKNLENVDALIDGHSHSVYSKTVPDKNGKQVTLAQTGTKLNNIGVLKISSDGKITHENINTVPFDSNFASESLNTSRGWVDKEMYEYINNITDSFSDQLNVVVGKTGFPMNVFKQNIYDQASRDQLNRLSENTLCNIVTDAMRHFGQADISIMNGGSVRENIDAGDITYKEVIDTMPFSNDVIVKVITGQDILDALEWGARLFPQQNSRFAQVSGLTYKINVNISSTVKLDENENFKEVSGTRRVYDVFLENGTAIDPNKNYTIASNSFILNGGDGYSMFGKYKDIYKLSIGVDNEVLLRYINETLNGTIPEKYAITQNRVMKTRGFANELSDDIIILHTNDVHCGVQDDIGYDGLLLYKKIMQSKYKHVLLVDAGDHIQGGTLGLISNGIAIIDIMNLVGYDVATLGNHEFDYGVDQLEECKNRLNCGYISTNYCFSANKTTAGSIYDAYRIVEAGNKRIAFIGVATPQTLSKTSLITKVDGNGKPIYDFLTERNSQELYEAVQDQIDKVKSADFEGGPVDYVIIVAHLGINGDAEYENTSEGLLNNLKNVNALIDGHTHLVYSQTTSDKDGKQVLFAQTGTKLNNIGVLKIATDGTITQENIENVTLDKYFEAETLNVTRGNKPCYVENNMYGYIETKLDSFSDKLKAVVGRTAFPLNVYKSTDGPKSSHDQINRFGENILCNIVTDAMRHFGEADITIMNGGSVRENIDAGDITYKEVIDTMPFSNDVIVKVITGQDILDALEWGARLFPQQNSRFAQVSGLTYKINVNISSTVKLDENENFKEVSGTRRVYDVFLENGTAIDPNKNYTIASNSFILNGGDGYSMFGKYKDIYKLSIGVDNEVLLRYINETLNGTIPEKYAITQNRVMKTRGFANELSDDIIILHTNDVHCGVQDDIGYDGLLLYKKIMQSKYKHVLLVDAGDHIQGGTLGLISNGIAIIDIMNLVGYDVATLGNHEFDYGVDQLEECKNRLNCGYISTNYCFSANKTTAGSIYDAYRIVEAGNKRIAFIGVATPQTLSKTSLITKVDGNGKPIYDFLTERNSQELYEAVQDQIDKVKSADFEGGPVDYVIIVAHLGINGDAEYENTSEGLLNNLKNVNALIDGHTHLVYSQTTSDKDGKQVLFAQTGTKLNNIGVLKISANGAISQENIDSVKNEDIFDYFTLNISKRNNFVDNDMYNYIVAKLDSFSDQLNAVIGRTDFPLNIYTLGTVNKQSHDQLSRFGENILCNLVTDALRHFGEADVTIMNAGSVREDILEGDITYQEVINTMPFSNDVLVKEITGQDIIDALEFGARTLPGATSRFPQVSGITYKIDISIPSSVIVDSNEVFERVSGERRVYDVKVNDEPVDLNKKYTLSTNAFIIDGGDGYSMFAKYKGYTKMSIGVDNEVLLKYIRDYLQGVIPEKYQTVEGRIIKTEGKVSSSDIIILHTNDVHCGVQDAIGYDGLMLYKKILQKQYDNVILVDAGDHIQGGTMGLITNGMAIIDIMNKVGYDVATLGNHEFDYGVEQLEKCEQALNCKYISTNYCYHKNKQAIYPAYKIIQAGDKKIAFIGVATPQTLSKTSLITVKDSDGNLVYDFLTENHSRELYERVQSKIDEVRSQGVDYVIILSHLGVDGDAEFENTSAGLLKNIKNVDALIDGHTHLVYTRTTPDKTGKQVLFAQTGTKLNNIGVLKIATDGTITQKNIGEVPYEGTLAKQILNITRSSKPRLVDKEMYEYIENLTKSYSDILNRIIGYTAFNLTVYKNGNRVSHDQLSRSEENILCNLVTDALRHFGEADVTIMNAGSVREDILEGNITYQHVINTMPFSNDVLVKEITGQTILDALEYGVRTLPDKTSRFPQVSGITYKIDTSISSSVVVDENEVFVRVAGKRRVYNVYVNGVKLDLLKKYTISTNSFIIDGGDGYSMFVPFDVIKTSIGVDNEILLRYINETLNGTIPEKYKAVEGRIVKTDGKQYTDANGNPTQLTSVGALIKSTSKLVCLLVLLLF